MTLKRRVLVALLGALLLVSLAALVWPRQTEPTYQGRSLSEWLFTYEKGMALTASDSEVQARDKAIEAVRAIGTNAVPVLLHWMNHEVPPWRTKLLSAYYTHVASRFNSDYRIYAALAGTGAIHTELAIHGFEILGGQARQAVGELTRRLNAGDGGAALVLGMIGEDGLAPLLAVLSNQNSTNRFWAVIGIITMGSAGTNANAAVPALVKCLKDRDTRVARRAATALGSLALEPEIAVPALVESLGSEDESLRARAALALSHFKDRARPAVPVLVTALSDPARGVRFAATNALYDIAPEVLPEANRKALAQERTRHSATNTR